MNPAHQISATPLPLNRNFEQLKASALAIIRQLSGNQWTNHNDSDPGITIVDQLCYALSELGYCSNFPIEDILCQSNGRIDCDHQFYLPSDILTASPVTINDYRKLIIDDQRAVKNVYIKANAITGKYKVRLYLDDAMNAQTANEQARVCNAVDCLLAQHRNVGESFASVKALATQDISLKGTVCLDSQSSSEQVMAAVKQAVAHYISPPIKPVGYQQMLASDDDGFNGPQLKHGWYCNSVMAIGKRNRVCVDELLAIIVNTPGVETVEALNLDGQQEIDDDKVAQINDKLSWQQNGTDIGAGTGSKTPDLGYYLSQLKTPYQATKAGATVDTAPPLPQGQYRNISDYYSLQNTFPSFYGIGFDALPSNAGDHRIAQTRQLKGYLMVFDQLLANQFSQLANVAQLFSFKVTDTSAPAQGKSDDGAVDSISKPMFAPTYYCQGLYHIPGVKPLLIGSDSDDPFNRYISGLRDAMQSDTQRDERRDRMLNHLLARHGESGIFYDQMITTAHWYGSLPKTRVIIKSLMLQNYRLMSYHRVKGYNRLNATRLGTPGRYRLTQAGFDTLAQSGMEPKVLKALHPLVNTGYPQEKGIDADLEEIENISQSQGELIKAQLIDGNKVNDCAKYIDGKLDIQALEADFLWQAADLNNFSTFELLVNLLLGLKPHYELLSGLLLAIINKADFTDWTGEKTLYTDSGLRLTVYIAAEQDKIQLDQQTVLTINTNDCNSETLQQYYQAHKDQLDWLAQQRQGFVFSEQPLHCTSIFPNYVSRIEADLFEQQFDQLVAVYFPAHIGNTFEKVSFSKMSSTISDYIAWHIGGGDHE